MREIIKPEEMNALCCSSYGGECKFSENFLKLLQKRTGLKKEDL